VKKVVLLTGSSGFVGQAVLRQADEFEELTMMPLMRGDAAAQVLNARRNYRDAQVSLLNLSWPSMRNYSASVGEENDVDREWQSYERWLSALIDAAAQASIRFFQVGSGIEPYAMNESPSVADPYLTYARRKEEIWRKVQAAMPETCWRLRLHFLFGVGESSHRVVPDAIRACLTGESMTVGAPERRRCWLDVDDVARGLLTAVLSAEPENWDICGSAPISFSELFGLIGEATGKAANIEASERAVADAACLLVEPRKPAPFLSQSIGEPDDLRSRLIDYARDLSEVKE
jgi:nucleoside-diphosphate-sugar epimerase